MKGPSSQHSASISFLRETWFPSSVKLPDLAKSVKLNKNLPMCFLFVHTNSYNSSYLKPWIIIEVFLFVHFTEFRWKNAQAMAIGGTCMLC